MIGHITVINAVGKSSNGDVMIDMLLFEGLGHPLDIMKETQSAFQIWEKKIPIRCFVWPSITVHAGWFE